jgi:hypothetical protein
MRIFGVDGEKLKDSNPEQGGWHDLFMNNAPMLEVSGKPPFPSVDDQMS